MRPLAILIAALALASLSCLEGCKKSPTSGACGAGETANADPAICYKVPKGFTQRGDPLKRPGRFSIAYADEGKAKVDFVVSDLDGFDARWKGLQANPKGAKATDAKEEDFAGGKGKLLTYTTPEKEPRFVISALVRGAKKTLECEAEYRTSAPKPELLEICKSIHEP